MARDRVAETLGVDATMVRLIAPDVGGGFGVKNCMYPEMVLLCWAARMEGVVPHMSARLGSAPCAHSTAIASGWVL